MSVYMEMEREGEGGRDGEREEERKRERERDIKRFNWYEWVKRYIQLLESILYLLLIIQSLLYNFHTMSPNAMYTVNKILWMKIHNTFNHAEITHGNS